MEWIRVPTQISASRPWAGVVEVGPPEGISPEDCSTAHATFEVIQGGPFNGQPCFKVYARFNVDELHAMLYRGDVVELSLYTSPMVMHSMAIRRTDQVEDL
jgi:hypothetical protein